MNRKPQAQFKTMSATLRAILAVAALAATTAGGAFIDTLAQGADAGTMQAIATPAPLVVAQR